MASRASGRGAADSIRENFQPECRAVVSIPTSVGVILAGPTTDGTVFVIKSFSRVINRSGSDRTVSFYLVPTGDSAADANSIGKDLDLPANKWLPFGEKYLGYGYSIYGVASGSGCQISWDILRED